MARDADQVPTALLHALKHYKVLHERIVLLNVLTRDVPHVGDEERLDLRDLGNGHIYAAPVVRLYGRAEYPARAGAVPHAAFPLQPAGNLVHHRARESWCRRAAARCCRAGAGGCSS